MPEGVMPESSNMYICSGHQHIAYLLALAVSTNYLECTTASSRTKGALLVAHQSLSGSSIWARDMLTEGVDCTC